MGRLTRDPELRYTQTGTAVASFGLAVERDFKDGNDNKQTDFIDVIAWRNTAEFVSKYFVKGQLATVSGRLQIRDWQGIFALQEGRHGHSTEKNTGNDAKRDSGENGKWNLDIAKL